MGAKYTTQAIANYNASPPADDGSEVAANQVTWAKHKTKLADPIKTLTEAINTALVAYVNEGPVEKTGAYTTDADDHNKIIECQGTFQITLLAPATAGAGYRVTVINAGSGVITVAPASGNIDGAASRLLGAGVSLTTFVNADEDEYLTQSRGGEFAIGTAMLFYQASAPTGWATAAPGTRYMVCVNDTGGSSGGSVSPISWNSAHTHDMSGTTGAGSAHTHTLTIATGGAHTHTLPGGFEIPSEAGAGYGPTTDEEAAHGHTGSTAANESSHTHTFSDTSTSAGGTFAPLYLEVVVGTKA